MPTVRFTILFPFHNGPYGGANQFLKALKGALVRAGAYVDDAASADIVIFNSHHDLDRVAAVRRSNPDAVFIHRVDGPMRLYNGPDDARDLAVAEANHRLAGATVFQSEWSRRANEEAGFRPAGPSAVIPNAADPILFNRDRVSPPLSGAKVRLVGASWSANANKGFDVYAFLDREIDFSRFEMVFIGNTPIPFSHIRHVPSCSTAELAQHLKQSDIFIAASRFDPCSNALIEALSCGLPAIARNEGGHPELVGDAGALFDRPEQVPQLIDGVVSRYETLTSSVRPPHIDDIARRYIAFAGGLAAARVRGRPATLGYLRRIRRRFSGAAG